MSRLKLSKSNAIIRTAFKKGEELGLQPLAIAVLDAGGHLKAFQAQDGTSILRPQIAHGKAYGALAMGMGSRAINKLADDRPNFANAANALAGGALVPVPGGVLIRARSGDIIGAVGVTGDTSENDEACARAGIEAAGLTADCG
jgi:uncharacterized protein GlcG (DUF336 family)